MSQPRKPRSARPRGTKVGLKRMSWFEHKSVECVLGVIEGSWEVFETNVLKPLEKDLPSFEPRGFFAEFYKKHEKLCELAFGARERDADSFRVEASLLPLCKALFVQARLSKAAEIEQQKARTINPDAILHLEKQLAVFDDTLAEPWFRDVTPEYPPALSDVLNTERVERAITEMHPWQDRIFDEKFHILQAPTLLQPDLQYYRAKCGLRGRPVSLAFLDIDNFKALNTQVGETHVDRHVLPVFMRTVEAHLYGHGHAYRFGGDEYVLLLPNADSEMALLMINGLRETIRNLSFLGVMTSITVSTGLCTIDRDCFFTEGELLQRAERAKNFAKKQGRDCIAGYLGSSGPTTLA